MKELIKVFLPEVLTEYFNLESHQKGETELHFYFEEKNILPHGETKGKVHSKGFYKEAIIQDFPIRGLEVYLHIKRRKWIEQASKKIIKRDWNLVSKGTRMTKEFANFLKEYH